MMRSLLFLLLSLIMTSLFAEGTTINSADVNVTVNMRNHGYTLGDIITMHAEFTLEQGYIFDLNSVPLQGPINAWLDLRDVTANKEKLADDREFISLDFTWQLFGTVGEAQIIQIPAIILQTLAVEVADDDREPLIITIPEQGFYLSPVLPEQLTSEETLRPIITPPRFDEAMPLNLAFLYLVLGILLALAWLWLQDRIKWLPRHPGAMTLLARQLRQQETIKQTQFTADDLRAIHAGLAGSSGQSLYPNTLDILFEKAPYLSVDKETITQFFDDSWRAFHETNAQDHNISVAETMAWIKRATVSERLFRHAARKS
ncbi:MAG: hypothetical protein GQ547_03470 [Methylophaga sp.]|nr:hypothetical protein [Methylophaga sp.]